MGGGHVGPYLLVEPLGRGGMGEVWRAEDPTGAAGGAPRSVALKLLDPALASDASLRARFAREVAALRRVDSPYVAPLLDADADAEVPWLASAYVAGPALADHVARHGPLAGSALRALAAALAEALVAIHAVGVVHRDLTPRNVVLGPDGPRVVDFGIAWFAGAVPVTQAGAAVGTPTWMAPERLASGTATAASDVWSWGAVMAYAAGGVDELPAWLAPWVRAAMVADPAQRPPATALQAATRAGPSGDPARTRPGVTREMAPTREPAGDTAGTRVFETRTRARAHATATGRSRRRLTLWGSAVGTLAVAAAVGAVAELLASVLVASVLVVSALVLQFRRARRPDAPRPVPPTWAVALASPVVLGVGLVRTFGPVPGGVALAVLVVLFLLAGDVIT